MPLRVIAFCTYLSDVSEPWEPQDFDANKFVKAVKGKPIKGYAKIPVRGVERKLLDSNPDVAVDWFAIMAADQLKQESISRPFCLVPVPNTKSVVGCAELPRTHVLASAISKRVTDTSVLDVLRWKKSMASAHKDLGPRDPDQLYPNLKLIDKLPRPCVAVLVDDVMTSGGHLQACAALLRNNGATVDLALCAGRTVQQQPSGNRFAVAVEEIADYES